MESKEFRASHLQPQVDAQLLQEDALGLGPKGEGLASHAVSQEGEVHVGSQVSRARISQGVVQLVTLKTLPPKHQLS